MVIKLQCFLCNVRRTNKLLSLAENFILIKQTEYDRLFQPVNKYQLLLFLCLKKIGLKGKPLLGWQIPITCSNDFTKAKINKIDDKLILELMNNGEIPIIAGFQGINEDNNIVTW